MPWSAIIAAILQLVGPLISELLKKWLDGRLNLAAQKLGVPRGTDGAKAAELLGHVGRSLWFFQVAKKRLVRECRAACVPAIAAGRTMLSATEADAVWSAGQSAE